MTRRRASLPSSAAGSLPPAGPLPIPSLPLTSRSLPAGAPFPAGSSSASGFPGLRAPRRAAARIAASSSSFASTSAGSHRWGGKAAIRRAIRPTSLPNGSGDEDTASDRSGGDGSRSVDAGGDDAGWNDPGDGDSDGSASDNSDCGGVGGGDAGADGPAGGESDSAGSAGARSRGRGSGGGDSGGDGFGAGSNGGGVCRGGRRRGGLAPGTGRSTGSGDASSRRNSSVSADRFTRAVFQPASRQESVCDRSPRFDHHGRWRLAEYGNGPPRIPSTSEKVVSQRLPESDSR